MMETFRTNQTANHLIEWSKALDRLIQVAEKVYTIADVLLKMDMAFGEFGDLVILEGLN